MNLSFKRFLNSIKYSFDGLKYAYGNEQSLWLHGMGSILIIILGFVLQINKEIMVNITPVTHPAALPQSFAILAKGWTSLVTKSTVASIAVLRSSTAKTTTKAIINIAHWYLFLFQRWKRKL